MPDTIKDSVKERGVVFHPWEIGPLRDGIKTRFTRPVRPQPFVSDDPSMWQDEYIEPDGCGGFREVVNVRPGKMQDEPIDCPYGKTGDQRYVKERLERGAAGLVSWQAAPCEGPRRGGEFVDWRWKRERLPAKHCPRWASRFLIEVTGVHVGRVQDITCGDIYSEGLELHGTCPACIKVQGRALQAEFSRVWDSVYAKHGPSWSFNPWAWVVHFKVLKGLK